MTFIDARGDAGNGPYRCPCCGYLTLAARGAYEICQVCFREDDGQDEHDADDVRGGPNHALSLRQARQNFQAFGASDERRAPFVRDPLPHEHPDTGATNGAAGIRPPIQADLRRGVDPAP